MPDDFRQEENVHNNTQEIPHPLKGIRVVDLTIAGAGPSCTKLLSEAGAEVIWVEAPKGASTREVHKYDFYTAGKKAVCIDLKTPEGRRFIEEAIRRADVFVSNYRPKGIENLHLTYEEVCAIKPDIIYARLTGYGELGPDRNLPGYDPVAFWARSGMMQDIAEKGTLIIPPIAVGDISSGAVLFGGICTALFQRERTGRGCCVSTSLFANSIYFNHDALIEVQYGEEYPKSRKNPRRALLNNYRCRDGKWIALSMASDFDRYFHPLMEVMGLAAEDTPGRFATVEDVTYENAPEVVELLDVAFAQIDSDEAQRRLKSIDFPFSMIRATRDILADPQAIANGYILQREATVPPAGGSDRDGGGDGDRPMITIPAGPLKFDTYAYGTTIHHKGPCLGENTVEVLREMGFEEEEIRDMLERGIAKG